MFKPIFGTNSFQILLIYRKILLYFSFQTDFVLIRPVQIWLWHANNKLPKIHSKPTYAGVRRRKSAYVGVRRRNLRRLRRI